MKEALAKIEEYQTLTGQEGEHIDLLNLHIKCYFIKSKFLDNGDKSVLAKHIHNLLNIELAFCDSTFNYCAKDIILELITKFKN